MKLLDIAVFVRHVLFLATPTSNEFDREGGGESHWSQPLVTFYLNTPVNFTQNAPRSNLSLQCEPERKGML